MAPAGDGLVHGMGKSLVEADWPALGDDEVRAVLGRYKRRDWAVASREAVVAWHSPRPMSAAGVVRCGEWSVFVKRHHVAVRSPAQLKVEHQFATYLRRWGQPVPAVMRGADGATALRLGEFVYEVHQCATGGDIYRDAVSWSPFSSLGHARSAGRALALFHEAARGFARPARSPGVLVSSACLVSAADPRAELGRLVASRPGLRHALAGHNLERDFELHCLPATSKAAPLLRALESQWGHGDWHASNLTWSSAGPGAAVAGVLDLGLANRTFAVHDLAVALERNTVDWLDLAGAGRVSADLDAVDALLEGYGEVRPLSGLEAAALVEVLPVVHCEHALAEVEYFAEVVGSTVNRDLAYDGYLIGHARWFQGAEGSELLDHLRSRFGPAFAGHASTARVSDPDALATVKEG